MATREENIKKINEELEKLDDEQLEQVAGGAPRRMYEPYQNTANDQNTASNLIINPKASWWTKIRYPKNALDGRNRQKKPFGMCRRVFSLPFYKFRYIGKSFLNIQIPPKNRGYFFMSEKAASRRHFSNFQILYM